MSHLVNSVLVFLLAGCAISPSAGKNDLSKQEQRLVGTWMADIDFAKWITTRYPDRTFTEKRVQIYDYKKPSIEIVLSGTWKVQGGSFCQKYDSVSNKLWNPLLGRWICEKIIESSPSILSYWPDDSPRIIEKKIPLREISLKSSSFCDLRKGRKRKAERVWPEWH